MLICLINKLNEQLNLIQLLTNQYNIAHIYIKLDQINVPGHFQQQFKTKRIEIMLMVSKRSNGNVFCLQKRKKMNSWTFLYEVLYRIQIWSKIYYKIIFYYSLQPLPMDRQAFINKVKYNKKPSSQIINKKIQPEVKIDLIAKSELLDETKEYHILQDELLQGYSGWSNQISYMKIPRNPKCQIPPQFLQPNDFQESQYKQAPIKCYANQYIKIHILMNNLYLRRCKKLKNNGCLSYDIFFNNFIKREGFQLIKLTKAKSPFCKICSKFYDESTQGLSVIKRYLRDYQKDQKITQQIKIQLTYLNKQIKNAPSCRSINEALKLSSNQLIKELRLFYVDDPLQYQQKQPQDLEHNQHNLNRNQVLGLVLRQNENQASDLQSNSNGYNLQSHFMRLQVEEDSDQTYVESQSQSSLDSRITQ